MTKKRDEDGKATSTRRDGRAPHKNFRCEDELWANALEAARWRGDVLSAVLRKHLVNYVRATDRKRAEEADHEDAMTH